ncbi:MAG: DMT family transporter [Pseudomonadota bacterium]
MRAATAGRAYLPLLVLGAGWGGLQPLNKIAVEGGFQPLGIMAWQGAVTLILAGGIVAMRGDALPRGRPQWAICAQVAVLGTLLPHLVTYTAVDHLPAGLMAILLATIPLMALPLGLVVGTEVAAPRRVIGLALGLAAVVLIALQGDSVSGGAGWAVAVALAAPFCYALNSTLIAARGMAGLAPIRAFFGAAILILPSATLLALASGQAAPLFAPGTGIASLAVLTIAAAHTCLYAGFLWLIGRSGAVFASQTAFLVTGFGVLWSALLLGERYPLAVLLAGGLMLAGMALVRPAAPARTARP